MTQPQLIIPMPPEGNTKIEGRDPICNVAIRS
jgi:hypothetical protein